MTCAETYNIYCKVSYIYVRIQLISFDDSANLVYTKVEKVVNEWLAKQVN